MQYCMRLFCLKPIRDILELISKNDWDGIFPTKDHDIFTKDKKIHGSTANARISLLKTAYEFHMEEITRLDKIIGKYKNNNGNK